MNRLIASVAIALTVLSECPAQNLARPDAAAAAGIDALREGLVDSFVKGDIDRLLTFLAPDVVVTWQNGEVCRGPEEVRAYYNKMMKGERPIVKKVTAQPEVAGRHIYSDWAVSWGNLRDHFQLTDGSDLALNSVFTATTAKQGDRWLVTGYHASVNAFENPILTLAIRKVGTWAAVGGIVLGLFLGFVGSRIFARKTDPA